MKYLRSFVHLIPWLLIAASFAVWIRYGKGPLPGSIAFAGAIVSFILWIFDRRKESYDPNTRCKRCGQPPKFLL